jgi:hypothetical protein
MATQHNRRFAVAQRRQRITELYVKGWSQAAIAAELSVAQSTISEDVQFVRRKWEESSILNFDELRTRELQKLEYIEREAWAAWERSQRPSQSAVVSDEGPGQRTRKSLKQQIGDPRFLDQVNKCIAQRRAITGLDVVPAPAASEGQRDGNVTLQVRQERVYALVNAFLDRERIGQPGAGPDSDQPGNVCLGDERGALADGSAPAGAG